MIDIHSHILPNVDDGSNSQAESLEILKELASLGFTEVFITPHYIEGSEQCSAHAQNAKIFKQLQTEAKAAGLNLKLHLGNEIYFTQNLTKLLESKKVAPIKTKYLLVELPFHSEINNLADMFHEVKLAGFIPILAHPERYDFVQKNPQCLEDFKRDGVLLQCNYGSIIGQYGRKAQKTLKYLLAQRLVDFMGTDVHCYDSRILTDFPKIIKKLQRYTTPEYFAHITKAGAFADTKPKTFPPAPKHTARKIFLAILAAVIIASVSVAGFYLKKTDDFVKQFTSESSSTEQIPDIANTPFTVYISGIDTSGDIDNVARSDVNMVVAVNPSTEKVFIANIPRDFYVPIHGTGSKDKLTHTGVLGIENTIATVEDFMDIDIDYYVRLNFTTMKKMVEIIGGLELDSDSDFTAYTDRGCHFQKGTNYVDGRCALAFARERKSYMTGDMHRVENQGQVMQKIIAKLSNPEFFATHYLEILDAASENMRTNISEENLTKVINLQIYQQPNWQVERYALIEHGSYNYGYFYPNQKLWMGEPDWQTVTIAHDKIVETITPPQDTLPE